MGLEGEIGLLGWKPEGGEIMERDHGGGGLEFRDATTTLLIDIIESSHLVMS